MKITLESKGIQTQDDWTGIFWRVHAGDEAPIDIEHSVKAPYKRLLPAEDNADHALAAVLLYAMEHDNSLEVKGSLSARLLDGIQNLQEIWSRWKPDRYKKISITCYQEVNRDKSTVDLKNDGKRGLFAFSGGVDATFSLMRHYYNEAVRLTIQPKSALLVQGFDIPYSADDEYAGAKEGSKHS